MKITLSFFLLCLSTLLTTFIFIFIAKKKKKAQIHYVFLCNMGLLIVWCTAVIIEKLFQVYKPAWMIFCEIFAYFGASFIPVFLLFTGLIFAHTNIHFTWKHLLLFVIPITTMLVLITNQYHHLFYTKFTVSEDMTIIMKYGIYFYIHSAFSYLCICIALYYLIYFSVKNSGFFSKQALLIIIGTMGPVLVNLLFTFKIGNLNLSLYDTPTAFSFAMICYMLSIFKYDFLNISPIALQNIVDRISDSFVVISDSLTVVDYNKSFIDTFGNVLQIRRNASITSILESNTQVDIDIKKLIDYINQSKTIREPVVFEKTFLSPSLDKCFIVEITSILSGEKFIGTVILLKDITQDKKNQQVLLEQERLASLGQLIGGIAHNLKTPIMSLSGGIEALTDLVDEYESSIDDETVLKSDHHDIAGEMKEWLEKMKPYCSYMSDIISAVKGQAVQMNASTTYKFTVDELVKRVDLLMKHELKKYHCAFNMDFKIDMNTEIKGEINNLVQVFDNIIMNSVQAYEGKQGIIDFIIEQKNDNIEFIFRDYAKGIPENIADKLFREMITTKGKNGTGLGLYMSYATVKGRLGGNMTFASKEGSGTTFTISIPCITYNKEETT